MLKKQARSMLVDKLHKGFVLTCVGLTIYGSVIIGEHFYRYFRYMRPQAQAAKELATRELLAEGSSDKMLLKD